jgi:hypothetical protein
MALLGTLWVDNKTSKILKIYQGPKHKNYRGAAAQIVGGLCSQRQPRQHLFQGYADSRKWMGTELRSGHP